MLKQSSLMIAALALLISSTAVNAETIKVTINKLVFSPAEIQAKIGDTIEWVNNDVFAHTATVKDAWEVMLPPKKSGSYVVKDAGVIDYYCRFHPNMKGKISAPAE